MNHRDVTLYADALFFTVVGPCLVAVAIAAVRDARRWERARRVAAAMQDAAAVD